MSKLVWFILNIVPIFVLGFLIPAPIVAAEDVVMANTTSAGLTTLVNIERSNHGLSALTQSSLLQKAAELKAADIIKRGYFDHNTPDGKLPWYWLEKVGYNYQHAGENLAVSVFGSGKVVDAWMNSPGHRENILKKEYTQIGTVVTHGIIEGEETVFVVQIYATPKRTSTVTQVTSAPTPAATLPVAKINSEPTETISMVKISNQPETAVVPPKKVIEKIAEKKTAPRKELGVLEQETTIPEIALAQETSEAIEYPRLFYTYDNGRECIIA